MSASSTNTATTPTAGTPAATVTHPAAFPWSGLIIIASAIFLTVTTEFLPTGLLPDMARELTVSPSQIGFLVTVFAGTVVLSTAPLTILTRKYSRKRLVVVVMLVLAFGTGLAAIAPSYEILLLARVIGGLAHGLFWAVVGAYAGHLVPKHQLGRAIAITSAGGTTAFVLGIPVGTMLGHAVGWRLAFAIVGVAVVGIAALVVKFLPPVVHLEHLRTGEIPLPLRKDRSIRGVALICVIIIVMMLGQFTFYTYIAPYLIAVSGFPGGQIGLLLLAYGLGGAVGLALSAVIGARYPRGGLIGSVVLVVLSVLTLTLFSTNQVVVVVAFICWGTFFGGVPALLQVRMLQVASARIRDAASASFATAFNIAIACGALIGGTLIDRVGIAVLPWVELMFLVAALGIMVMAEFVRSRSRSGA
ncbi:MAG: MFS transporter [Microbacteriaceae bacterium]|nr:MFS transporter [Microbacteriaceae bacterium]